MMASATHDWGKSGENRTDFACRQIRNNRQNRETGVHARYTGDGLERDALFNRGGQSHSTVIALTSWIPGEKLLCGADGGFSL